jgi:glycosyltransferase involved in cell wall biosynthesis
MDSQIIVSVALATYNGEKYLRQQLDSIYYQTIFPYEVVVYDDCSSDETINILEEYKISKGLKYWINDENLGFYRNFERAIMNCSGDFIALSDQDDIWMPNKLERLINEIGNHSLICSDAKLINANDIVFQNSYFQHQNLYPYYCNQFLNLLINNYVTGCTTLFKKELLNSALPMPNIRYHDQWLGLVAAKSAGVFFLAEKLILYRQHSLNDTGAHKFITLKAKIRQINILIRSRTNFRNRNAIVIKEIAEILNSNLGLSHNERKILENLIVFYKNRMRFVVNPICVFFALKYNKLLFGYHRIMHKRLLAAFGTLFF